MGLTGRAVGIRLNIVSAELPSLPPGCTPLFFESQGQSQDISPSYCMLNANIIDKKRIRENS